MDSIVICPSGNSFFISVHSLRPSRNTGRVFSGSSFGAIHIRPFTRTCVHALAASTAFLNSSGENPYLLSSPEILNSRKTSCTFPALSAFLSISFKISSESQDWMRSAQATAFFTLFFCKCPCKFQTTGADRDLLFSSISCTRFSPTWVTPRRMASSISSSGWNFVTATSVTSCP